MIPRSDSELETLHRYIEEYGEDSHISEAMWLLRLEESEVIKLASSLPKGFLPRAFRRAVYPSEHNALKEKAMEIIRSYGLRPNKETKLNGFKFDTIGFDSSNRPLVAIECGGISSKRRLKAASKSIGLVLHWPYGAGEPHVLGGCKRCKL